MDHVGTGWDLMQGVMAIRYNLSTACSLARVSCSVYVQGNTMHIGKWIFAAREVGLSCDAEYVQAIWYTQMKLHEIGWVMSGKVRRG